MGQLFKHWLFSKVLPRDPLHKWSAPWMYSFPCSRHRRFSVPLLQLQWIFIFVWRVRGWVASGTYRRGKGPKASARPASKGGFLFSELVLSFSCGHSLRSVKKSSSGWNPSCLCHSGGPNSHSCSQSARTAFCQKLQLSSSYFLECPPESNSCSKWANPPVQSS